MISHIAHYLISQRGHFDHGTIDWKRHIKVMKFCEARFAQTLWSGCVGAEVWKKKVCREVWLFNHLLFLKMFTVVWYSVQREMMNMLCVVLWKSGVPLYSPYQSS